MPSPTVALATLRPELAGSLEEFDLALNRLGFVGMQILAPFPVGEQSGTFGRIPLAQLLSESETLRAPGTAYNRGQWDFENESYACVEYGHEEPVDDRESKMYANYFDAEVVSAERARNFVLQGCEFRTVALLLNTATFADAAASVPWSTHATADPIGDVRAAGEAVRLACGRYPNTLTVDRKTYRDLQSCTQILDRIKYQNYQDARAGKLSTDAMAQVFDLERVLVAGGVKNTGSIAPVWDSTKAFLSVTGTTRDIREPCIGRTFHWDADGGSIGATVESYRDETVRSDIIRARMDVHEKLLYAAMGYIITGVSS